jgi:hypothetical protein
MASNRAASKAAKLVALTAKSLVLMMAALLVVPKVEKLAESKVATTAHLKVSKKVGHGHKDHGLKLQKIQVLEIQNLLHLKKGNCLPIKQ